MAPPRGKRVKHPDMEKALHAVEELEEAGATKLPKRRVTRAIVAKNLLKSVRRSTLYTSNQEKYLELVRVSNEYLEHLEKYCRFLEKKNKKEGQASGSRGNIFKAGIVSEYYNGGPTEPSEQEVDMQVEIKKKKAKITEISAALGGTDDSPATSKKGCKRVVMQHNKKFHINETHTEDLLAKKPKKTINRIAKKKSKKTPKSQQSATKCLKRTYSKQTQTDQIILPHYTPEGDVAEPTDFDMIGERIVFVFEDLSANLSNIISPQQDTLKPGVDIIITVNIYSAFVYEEYLRGANFFSSFEQFLHNNPHMAVFQYSMTLTGRHKLSDIRDYFVCNENGCTESSSRSGFLLSQNAFFMDFDKLTVENEAEVTSWRFRRNVNSKPKFDINIRLDRMVYELNHPELYVHDASCEHLIFFSNIRYYCAEDPGYVSDYPRVISRAHYYDRPHCTRCGDLNPAWMVYDCDELYCKPGFYCQFCVRTTLYDGHGRRLFQFKVRKNDLLPQRA